MDAAPPPDVPISGVPAAARRWEPFAAAALCAAALALYARAQYRGLRLSDDFEYAHVARNVLRGRGFETQQLNPLDLQAFAGVPHANVLHPPGTPLLIAPSFAVFGATEFAAVLPMALCHVALGALVFLLAARLFGRGAAWCAAAMFAIHPGCLRFATLALSETPTALCLAGSLLAVLAARRPRGLFVAGLLAGAAVWFRENAATYAAALVLAASLTGHGDRRARIRRCLPLVLGFAVPVALLSIRSMVAFGRPWFSYSTYHVQGYSALFDGVEIFRHLRPPTFAETFAAHPDVIRGKVIDNLAAAPQTFWDAAGAATSILLAAHLVLPARPAVAAAKSALLVAVALHFAAHAVFTSNQRHLAPYVPLAIVFAGGTVAAAAGLVRRRGGAAAWGAAALTALLLVGMVRTYRTYTLGEWRTNDWSGLGAWVGARTAPGAVIVTDQPEPVVWGADRCAVVVPVDRAGLDEIDARVRPTHLLATSRLAVYPKTAWLRPLLDDPGPHGWREEARYDDGKLQATLYARVR